MLDAPHRLNRAQIYLLLLDDIKAAGGQAEWARLHGFSRGQVGDVVNARAEMPPRFAAALGYAPRVEYVKLRTVPVAEAAVIGPMQPEPAHASA